MDASEISKIEVFPLNLIFHFQNGGKTILRFGTAFTDKLIRLKVKLRNLLELTKLILKLIIEEI